MMVKTLSAPKFFVQVIIYTYPANKLQAKMEKVWERLKLEHDDQIFYLHCDNTQERAHFPSL